MHQESVIFTPDMIKEDSIIEYVLKLNESTFSELLRFLNHYYHNEESLISDKTYDDITSIYNCKYGTYSSVGADPIREKVQLPYYLGSLRKVKETSELLRWSKQYPGPYIIEDKIDGVSLLLTSDIHDDKRTFHLYTRGNGEYGQDVSHLLRYIQLPFISIDIAVRGEIVLTKEAFTRVGAEFKNARNLVAGIVNTKRQFDPMIVKELKFYAYHIMNKENTCSEDIELLQQLGFSVPSVTTLDNLTREDLEKYLLSRRDEAPYEIDGLVIYQNKSCQYPVGENPRHVIAFKTITDTAITTVTRVIWRASMSNSLKPVVCFNPVDLLGGELRRAFGYNARFIVNNNIGTGAIILITRSGGINPKILTILTPSPTGPDLPDVTIHGEYRWNTNLVEFITITTNVDAQVSKLHHFLTTLDIKNMGRKRIESLITANITDIAMLLKVTSQELSNISGFGPKLSNNLYVDIQEKIKNIPLAKILDASGFFPQIGTQRFEAILKVHPNLLDLVNLEKKDLIQHIQDVPGFNILANTVADNLEPFILWLQENAIITIAQTNTNPIDSSNINTLEGMTVVFSGFRDPELKSRIEHLSGKVSSIVSRNTTYVIMKNTNDIKSKAKDAQELKIPIISKEEFLKIYF